MVGSGFSLMDVRYLDHGKQRQKDQTQDSHDRQST
jgi:hypothetical protein